MAADKFRDDTPSRASSGGVDHPEKKEHIEDCYPQRAPVAGRQSVQTPTVSPAGRTLAAIAEDQGEANNKSRPNSGTDESRHLRKDDGNRSNPQGSIIPPGFQHSEKSDGVNRVEPISRPGMGYIAHPEKADGKNRTEPLSNPQGDDSDIPKENLHADKHKAHSARTFEPKPAGKTDSVGHPFKSTKRG